MKSVKAVTLSIALVAGLAVGMGTAAAVDAPTADVGFQSSLSSDGKTVNTVLDAGIFIVKEDGTNIAVVNDAGAAIASIPLAYSVNGTTYSIEPLVSQGGKTLSLTPTTHRVDLPLTQVSKQSAQDNLVTQIGIGWANGGAIGTIIGAGLGFAIGCVSIFPNFISGCIIGTIIGTIAGTVIGISNANPAVQPAFFEFVNTP